MELYGLNTPHPPVNNPNMRMCAYTKDLSEELSTQLSSLLAQGGKNLVDGSVHMSVQTSNSSPQGLCQKENQRTNRELGQSCTELNVCLKWLIVSLMVHQLSAVITADCQEILCDVCFFFCSQLNRDNSTIVFCCKEDTLNHTH